ncbi:MAG: hypothetical protein QM715_15635 [Nibricoccus sp.]
MKPLLTPLLGLLVCAGSAFASFDDKLDRASDTLRFSSEDENLVFRVSGTVEAEAYSLTLPYESTVYTEDTKLDAGRLKLWLDARFWKYIYFFTEVRVDDGYDPGSDQGLRARIGACAVRASLGDFAIQAGKFATVVGAWPRRYNAWENSFITAPLPYSHLTGIWESEPALSPSYLLRWSHVRPRPAANREQSDQHFRQPIIWGPSYSSGAALFWLSGPFSVAAEVKNAALSASPYRWNTTHGLRETPALATRLGYKPNASWELGVSASTGTYLESDSRSHLPSGAQLRDYRQITTGADASFAWHHWQVWAEAFAARFEIPHQDAAEVFSWYLETRYKVTARFFCGVRLGQQLYGKIHVAPDEKIRWGRDVSSLEFAPVFRINAHLQAKAQFSLIRTEDSGRDFGHVLAGQLTLRF